MKKDIKEIYTYDEFLSKVLNVENNEYDVELLDEGIINILGVKDDEIKEIIDTYKKSKNFSSTAELHEICLDKKLLTKKESYTFLKNVIDKYKNNPNRLAFLKETADEIISKKDDKSLEKYAKFVKFMNSNYSYNVLTPYWDEEKREWINKAKYGSSSAVS